MIGEDIPSAGKSFNCRVCGTEFPSKREANRCEKMLVLGDEFQIGDQFVYKEQTSLPPVRIISKDQVKRSRDRKGGFNHRRVYVVLDREKERQLTAQMIGRMFNPYEPEEGTEKEV